jgi:prolyl-tRNA synthetase
MRQSQLFGKTIRQAPKDEITANSQLLMRGGFIDKLAAGIYTLLPLGYIVVEKLGRIIREAMTNAGGQELTMPVLHPRENWEKTNRWRKMDVLFHLKSRNGEREYALGPTHEEVITPLAKKYIQTYKDLPFYLFQIQTKMRDEKRAKSGLIRCREFLMKDLYSFHADEKDLDEYYEKMKEVYGQIFKKAGIGESTFLTFASGGTFSKFSHEFQTIASAGEDVIYICQDCHQAVNREIKSEIKNCPNCRGQDFKEEKAVEVGNIFKLKAKFSEPFGLSFLDKDGARRPIQMGCYGIGLGRLMATIVEVCHDEKGIVWPKEVAPYSVHLVGLGNTEKVKKTAEKLYQGLQQAGIEVLYDDRFDKTAGEKFIDADLIGIPLRLVASERTLAQNSVEFKERAETKTELVSLSESIKEIKDFIKLCLER